MKEVAKKYDKDALFENDMISDVIVTIKYPEVGVFFNQHVMGK